MTLNYLVLCAIFSVLSVHSKMLPVKQNFPKTDNNQIVFTLPKAISNGTDIIIIGKINAKIDMLDVTLTGLSPNSGDDCNFIFNPSKNTIEVKTHEILTTENYFLMNHHNHDSVHFNLEMKARLVESEDAHIMDLYFEANNAGPLPIPPCIFPSFDGVHFLIIKGVQHIQTLAFHFTENVTGSI